MKPAFITAAEIAKDHDIPEGEAEKLMKWLSEEAKIQGVPVIDNKKGERMIPRRFYELILEEGFIPKGARRLVPLEYLCNYLGVGKQKARLLGDACGWRVFLGHSVRYDMHKVKEWLSNYKHEGDEQE